MSDQKNTIVKADKPDKRTIFILPNWAFVFVSIFLGVILLTILADGLLMLATGQTLVGSLFVAMWCYFVYKTSSYFVALPVTMRVHERLHRQSYFEMEKSNRNALKTITKLRLPKDESYGVLWINLGISQLNLGKYKDAEISMSEAISVLDRVKTKNGWNRVLARLDLAAVYLRQMRLHDALKAYDDCDELIAKLPAAFQAYRVLACMGRAKALLQFDAVDEAEEHLKEALDLLSKDKVGVFTKRSLPSIRFACDNGMALVSAKRKQFDHSLQLLNKMILCANETPHCGGITNAQSLTELAKAYLEGAQLQAAERVLELGYYWAQKEPMHPDCVALLDVYAQLLEQTNRTDEVPDLRRWIRHVEIPNQSAVQHLVS